MITKMEMFTANAATPSRVKRRELSAHQKQIRFMTIFFGTLMVLSATGLLWLLNK